MSCYFFNVELIKLARCKIYLIKILSKYIINLYLKFCSLQNGTSCKFRYTQLLLSNIGSFCALLTGLNTHSCNLGKKQHKIDLQISCRFSIQHLPLGANFKSHWQFRKARSPVCLLDLSNTPQKMLLGKQFHLY